MAETKEIIIPSSNDAAKLLAIAKRARRPIRGGPGVVVSDDPDAVTISLGATRDHRPQGSALNNFYRITNRTGSFPAWSYTVQLVLGYNSSLTGVARWVTDGVNITGVLNRCEFAPSSGYPYEYGTGNTITDSSGTVNGGSCVVIPIGIGSVVEGTIKTNQSGTPFLSFYAANSAQ